MLNALCKSLQFVYALVTFPSYAIRISTFAFITLNSDGSPKVAVEHRERQGVFDFLICSAQIYLNNIRLVYTYTTLSALMLDAVLPLIFYLDYHFSLSISSKVNPIEIYVHRVFCLPAPLYRCFFLSLGSPPLFLYFFRSFSISLHFLSSVSLILFSSFLLSFPLPSPLILKEECGDSTLLLFDFPVSPFSILFSSHHVG